jgi:hypothetical protein
MRLVNKAIVCSINEKGTYLSCTGWNRWDTNVHISSYVSLICWAMCLNIFPSGLVWWAPGRAPKGSPHPPSVAQIQPQDTLDIHMLMSRDRDPPCVHPHFQNRTENVTKKFYLWFFHHITFPGQNKWICNLVEYLRSNNKLLCVFTAVCQLKPPT